MLQGHPLGFRGTLRGEQGQLHPAQVAFGLFYQTRLGGDLHPQLGGSLIDEVDGGIRQAAIGDVAIREAGRGHDGAIGNRHPVVELVALLQPPQDQGALLQARLLDQDLLEAPVERRVLLNGAAVLLRGRRADATQVTPGQRRLEDAAGVAVGALGPHDVVELIDEEDHPARLGALGLAHLLEDAAQALFKLPAELGTGDQGPQIQGDQTLPLEGIRHFTGHDPLGQQLGDGGLAHAGLTNEDRVVLAPAGEHLHQAPNFGVAANHRIEITRPGGRGEISAELLEGRRLLFQLEAVLRGSGFARGSAADGGALGSRGLHDRSRWSARGWSRPGAGATQVLRGQPLLLQEGARDAAIVQQSRQKVRNIDEA